jgi:hypothetical protein
MTKEQNPAFINYLYHQGRTPLVISTYWIFSIQDMVVVWRICIQGTHAAFQQVNVNKLPLRVFAHDTQHSHDCFILLSQQTLQQKRNVQKS